MDPDSAPAAVPAKDAPCVFRLASRVALTTPAWPRASKDAYECASGPRAPLSAEPVLRTDTVPSVEIHIDSLDPGNAHDGRLRGSARETGRSASTRPGEKTNRAGSRGA